MNFLAQILDIILIPFQWVWFVLSAPKRAVVRRSNWEKFKKFNKVRIEQWMKTHGENEKLPIYRDDNQEFHWVTRAKRRETMRFIKKRATK